MSEASRVHYPSFQICRQQRMCHPGHKCSLAPTGVDCAQGWTVPAEEEHSGVLELTSAEHSLRASSKCSTRAATNVPVVRLALPRHHHYLLRFPRTRSDKPSHLLLCNHALNRRLSFVRYECADGCVLYQRVFMYNKTLSCILQFSHIRKETVHAPDDA
jgi:hypothetical protein